MTVDNNLMDTAILLKHPEVLTNMIGKLLPVETVRRLQLITIQDNDDTLSTDIIIEMLTIDGNLGRGRVQVPAFAIDSNPAAVIEKCLKVITGLGGKVKV